MSNKENIKRKSFFTLILVENLRKKLIILQNIINLFKSIFLEYIIIDTQKIELLI